MPTKKGTQPWNAGKGNGWTDKRGYRWVYVTENGKRRARREHRLIMEQHLGRVLEPWEVVHHIDENPSNNDLANLVVVEYGAHTASHHTGTRHAYDAKRTMEALGLLRSELKKERDISADLYAALVEVRRVIEASEHWWMNSPDRGGFDADAIDAILAKARGEA